MTILDRRLAAMVALIVLGGCTQPVPALPGVHAAEANSILARSSPANGASVAGPVRRIDLDFNPPARLVEVTVTGPAGMMPMMVSAVGEVAHYELPLSSDLGPGAYRVDWKASIAGAPYQGSFVFTVR